MVTSKKSAYENSLLKRYNDRLSIYGYSPKSLGWVKGRQTVRFKILSQIGEIDKTRVLDIGCGFGDLFHFFKKLGKDVDYTGFDINPNFIETAKKHYPEAHFVVGNLLEAKIKGRYDWVFASGVFEFKYPNMSGFVEKFLTKMFAVATKGIAADFMTSYVDFRGGREGFYASPEEIFGIGKQMSKRVALRHDYMPYEFCIYIYKDVAVNERNVFASFDKQIKQEFGTNEFFSVK
jgi:SAM-dependent methyltransferase